MSAVFGDAFMAIVVAVVASVAGFPVVLVVLLLLILLLVLLGMGLKRDLVSEAFLVAAVGFLLLTINLSMLV